MAGWIVYIRISDRDGELVTRWGVAHADWSAALTIAATALGVDPAHKPPDVRVITIRAVRPATIGELDGVESGHARQIV